MPPLAPVARVARPAGHARSLYIEITGIPPLDARQRTLLEAHTLLNIYRVIRAELLELGMVLGGDQNLMRGSLALCDQAIISLERPESLYTTAAAANEQERRVFRDVETQLDRAGDPGAGVGDSVANLRSLFAMLRARAREFLLRSSSREPWTNVPVALLEAEFRDAFAAIERNSHGRYRIVFNPATQRASDYHMTFQVDAGQDASVVLPRVFTDVIRDLAANARKYTPPGGRIRASLRSNAQGLRLLVEDTGRGIPPAEIPGIVHFGVRGSNVDDIRTMGGGFGLTKAFVVTKRFGGRFWIDSQLGLGTRIRIWLPPPPAGSVGFPGSDAVTSAPVSPG